MCHLSGGKAPVFVKMCMEDYYNCSTEELRKTLKKLCRFGEKQNFPERTTKDRIKSLFFKRALNASRSVLYLSSADPYSGGIIACQMFELFIVFEWLLICNTEEKINEFFDFGWIESLPHLSQQPAKAGKYLYKIKQINPERFKLPNVTFKSDADYLNRKIIGKSGTVLRWKRWKNSFPKNKTIRLCQRRKGRFYPIFSWNEKCISCYARTNTTVLMPFNLIFPNPNVMMQILQCVLPL